MISGWVEQIRCNALTDLVIRGSDPQPCERFRDRGSGVSPRVTHRGRVQRPGNGRGNRLPLSRSECTNESTSQPADDWMPAMRAIVYGGIDRFQESRCEDLCSCVDRAERRPVQKDRKRRLSAAMGSGDGERASRSGIRQSPCVIREITSIARPVGMYPSMALRPRSRSMFADRLKRGRARTKSARSSCRITLSGLNAA